MGRSNAILPSAVWLEFLYRMLCISVLCGVGFSYECYINPAIDDSGPVVVTKTGAVVGTHVNVLDMEVPAFLGIPYAIPPVGERRFKIAEPIVFWNGIRFAKEKSAECMHYTVGDIGALKFSEDCLYLNVWLPPNCCCDRPYKLPVIVYINGAGYFSESAPFDAFDGDVLATFGEVIVVSFNYRSGVFGFLNIDSIDAPGNMGLYDQHLALRWIRENIYFFGGDPNRVTLFGENEGSLSVSLQMISPFSQNLFQRAILTSGVAAQPFKVYDINEARLRANLFSELVGCADHRMYRRLVGNDILKCLMSKNADELVGCTDHGLMMNFIRSDVFKCLMTKPAEELVLADNYFAVNYHFFTASYGNECVDCLKFFVDSPIKSALLGEFAQIPTMIGHNIEEGTVFMTYTIPRFFRWGYEELTIPAAKALLHKFFHNIRGTEITSNKVFDYYIKAIANEVTDNPLPIISRIYGDYFMKCGIMYFADNIKDAYFYLYSYHSHEPAIDEWNGILRLTETPYVFGDPIRNPERYSYEDIHISEDIMRKWSSFAYDGFPISEDSELEWPLYSASERLVFDLHSGVDSVIEYPFEEACEVWRPFFEIFVE